MQLNKNKTLAKRVKLNLRNNVQLVKHLYVSQDEINQLGNLSLKRNYSSNYKMSINLISIKVKILQIE